MKKEQQDYIAEQKKLMDEWYEGYIGEAFAEDGIVDPDYWFGENFTGERILFVLKEAFDNDGEIIRWNLANYLKGNTICMEDCRILKNGLPYCMTQDNSGYCKGFSVTQNTYSGVAEWTYGMRYGGLRSTYEGEKDVFKKNLLREVAVLNLKKEDGGRKSDNTILSASIDNNKKNIIKEINLIKPTVIVCGGTFNLLSEALEEPITENKDGYFVGDVADLKNVIVLKYCHPSAFLQKPIKYYGLLGIYNAALKKRDEMAHKTSGL